MRKTTRSARPFLSTDQHIAHEEDRRAVAGLTLTQVIKTHVPIFASSASASMTYGEILDAQLLQAAQDGRVIQEVSFGFEPEDWCDYAENLRQVTSSYEA